jgi:hypothetical protein
MSKRFKIWFAISEECRTNLPIKRIKNKNQHLALDPLMKQKQTNGLQKQTFLPDIVNG